MDFTVGAIIEGKVKAITKFGAFIALPEGKTGMVHISEVANAYVSDIRQHLTEGQDVKVMIIAIDPAGKINLSIKRLEPKPQPQSRPRFNNGGAAGKDQAPGGYDRPRTQAPRQSRPAQQAVPTQATVEKSSDQLFEERLKQFMTESDSKISSIKQYSEHRTKSRRR